MTLELQLFLLMWGTLVGLDLVSVPQMMIARPIVAGPVAGAILGDLATGLELGVLFELFQYDVMPMGATRYPEYGPATVAAVSTAHAAAGTLGLGLGALVGLVTGMLGGLSMYVVRRATQRAVQAVSGRLEAGAARLLVRLHVRARAGAGRATVFRGRAAAAGCDAARRRGGRRRDRYGDGGHTARGRSRGYPEVVRRGPRRRGGAGVAAVTRTRRPPLGRSLLRLFTVQGSWNYERLQGIGVGVAEEPLLRDLRAAGNGAVYRAAVARGAHFFNAHPYLCGLAVGAAARAEHEGATPDQIERLRSALCGPLGSLGDRLVWAGWLPVTSGLALVGVALGLGMNAVLGFLIVYNVGHVALRWWALRAGWAHGVRVAVALHQPFVQRAAAWSGPAMALVIGAALPLSAAYLAGPFPGWARGVLLAAAAVGCALLWWWRGKLTGLRYGLTLLAVAALAGWIWR